MQRSWSRIFALALGIPMLLAMLAACGSGTTGSGTTGTSSAGSTTIKIATELPVSGKDTSSGKPAENGAHFAVDEAVKNKTIPGYNLVFDPKDDVGPSGSHDPAVGQKNVTDLIGDALVAGIVGPFNSNVAKSVMPVANQAPIALISPSNTNQCLTQSSAAVGCDGANNLIPSLRPTGKVTYFRIATTDDHQSTVAADFLFKQKHLTKVYVIDDTEVYGLGIANGFEKEWKSLGGTELGRKSVPSSTNSYVSLLTQVAATHPDVIFFGGTSSTGGIQIRKQMGQVPALQNVAYAGGDGIQTNDFPTTIGSGGGPSYSTVAAVNADSIPSAKSFIDSYKTTYGAAAYGAYSAGGYDCAKILINAIKKVVIDEKISTPKDASDTTQAKVFRQAVIDAIQGTDYTGVTGHHTFDSNGDTTNKVISIYQVGEDKGSPAWVFVTQLTV